jgi:hypothetical protein
LNQPVRVAATWPVRLAEPARSPASGNLVALQLNNPRARTESLRTKVSVAGKRNFQGRDKEAETASKVRARHCRDEVSLNNPANSGLVSENQEISVCGRMRGGGRSRSQTRLPLPYSLLTGKRTGKNRYLRGNSRRDHRKGPGLYGFSWPFPVKNNRERFLA